MIRFWMVIGVCLLTFNMTLLGQENCTNGIDDDNDGLIDLNDPDCACGGLSSFLATSIIPNPSFEERTCCPQVPSSTFENPLDSCANNWIQASGSTTDYIHTCGYVGNNFILPPMPFPDGDGCIGMVGYLMNTQKHDYVGTRLNEPLEQDTSYTLSFYVGFGIETTVDPSFGFDRVFSHTNFSIAIYGNPGTNQLPFPGEECPTAYAGSNWELITTINVGGSEEWVEATVNFTPSSRYESIIIGAPCGGKPLGNVIEYYFLDNLILSETKNFALDAPIRSGSECTNDLVLESPFQDPMITYQWYRDGVAIAGETNATLDLGGGNIGGEYQVRLSQMGECEVSPAETVYDSGGQNLDITGKTVICGSEPTLLTATPGFTRYAWSNGSDSSTAIVTTPGLYSLTVTATNGCTSVESVNIGGPVVIQPNATITPSMDTDDNGSIVLDPLGGSAPYNYLWEDNSVNRSRNNLSSGWYTVTITDDNGCELIDSFEVVFIPADLEANIRVKNLDCFEDGSGRITLEIDGGVPPFSVLWNTGSRDFTIDNLDAGDYSVTITDSRGENLILKPTVEQPMPLAVDILEVVEPLCFGDQNGRIRTSISGGQSPYRIEWNGNIGSEELMNISAGTYQLRVEDFNNCVLDSTLVLNQPEALMADISPTDPSCFGYEDGAININELRGGVTPYDLRIDGQSVPLRGKRNLPAGSYFLELEDDHGCLYTETLVLNSPQMIDISIIVDQDRILQGNPVRLAAMIEPSGLNGYQLEWTSDTYDPQIECIDCPETRAFPAESGNFTVYLDRGVCTYSDEIYIEVDPSTFYAPNAFTPNGDGINDVFNFSTNMEGGLYMEEVAIMDRWGTVVHRMNGLELSQYQGWDGTLRGELMPVGVYVYTVRLRNGRGEHFQFAGDIMLTR